MENTIKDFDASFKTAKFKSGNETVSVLELKNKQVAAEADISKIVLRQNGSSEVLDLSGNRVSYDRKKTKRLVSELSNENTFKDLVIGLNKQIGQEKGLSVSDLIRTKIENIYENNPELRLAAEKVEQDITQALPKANDLKTIASRLSQSIEPESLNLKAESILNEERKDAPNVDDEVKDKKRRNRRLS